MSSTKLTGNLTRFMLNGLDPARSICWSGVYATRSLCSKKELEAQKTIEAADAVKEGAVKVKETADFVQKTTAETAKIVTGMTKDISKKAADTAEAIKKQATDSIVNSATEFVKEKFKGN